jgi:hypothetical protein
MGIPNPDDAGPIVHRPVGLPNPDGAGPIVHRPVGIPITAGCDTAWIQTRDCSDASGTEMQRHPGAQQY